MAFCSMLTARRVFKEVTVGILIVGHTHEDIDAYFSYLLKLLKMKNTYVLADLMKAFMDSQKTIAFIPELMQEVADFKKFLHGYQLDGANKFIGLGEMHLFKLYVEEKDNDMGWLVMRYKVHSQIVRISICPFFEWKYMSPNSIALSLCGCRRSADTSLS